MIRSGLRIALLAILVVLAAGWLGLLSSYYIGLITEAFIVALFAMSLDLLIGFTGLESLGHAAFFGTGAYVVGLLSLRGFDNVFLLLAAAAVAAGVLGAVFAAIALRAVGPYFLIITLALGYLPWALAIRWRGLTGGDDGLPGIFRPDLAPGYSLDSDRAYFTFVICVFLVCAAAIAFVGRSIFGQSLRGIKDSPSRMEALGYDIWLHKFVAFVIAAIFAGISGALFCFYNSFVSPAELSLYRSAEAMVAVILGGAGTLVGPAAAAMLILILRFTVSPFTVHWGIVLGIIYICVVLFAPRGIFMAIAAPLSRERA